MLSPRRFRPSMRSHRTLGILLVVSLAMYIWANNSRVLKTSDHYSEMLHASKWMQVAMDTLRAAQFPKGLFIDDVNDPNLSALIGQQFSAITTETGDLEAKWTALNPNMAAVMVLYFREAGVQRGDTIAAGVSGSFPGMNLAMYAAADAVGVVPVVITSLGASSWGANNPRFTWLHMEATLKEVGLLERGSVAASLGGGEDMGRQLSPGGREMLRESARRNGVPLIEEPLLEQAVHRRMVVYDSVAGRAAYELYANIGGGLASIGHSRNTQILEEGLHDRLPILNYPRRGVIHAFSDRDVPVLNIYNIVQIADAFDLPRTPNPLPQPGQGRLFAEERYSMLVTSVALLVVLATLIVVLLFDRRAQQLNRPGVDPDTLM